MWDKEATPGDNHPVIKKCQCNILYKTILYLIITAILAGIGLCLSPCKKKDSKVTDLTEVLVPKTVKGVTTTNVYKIIDQF